jgi:putative peptidoglycan lipid II flippase
MVERRKLLRSAAVFGGGTMLSRVAGLVRGMVITALFNSRETDMWIIGYRIPNLLRQMLGEGAMSMAVVPVLSDTLKNEGQEKTRETINSIYTVFLLILIAVTILGIIFSPFIVRLMVPAFAQIPGKIETTTYLTRIMFPYIAVIGLTAFAMGILNTIGHLWIPSVHPILWNLAIIAFAFIASIFDPRVTAIAIGFTVGGVLQYLIHIPQLKKYGFMPRLTLNINWAPIISIGKLLAPTLLSISVLQIAIFINNYFASSCGEGGVSYINWADNIVQLPIGVFAVAIGTAILPILCRSNNEEEIGANFAYAFKLSTLVMLPATAGMLALAFPITRVIYQRGQFTVGDATQTAMVMSFLALTLYPSGIIRITVPMYYSVKDTLRPALFSMMGLITNTIISYTTVKIIGLRGVSIAMAAANIVNSALLLAYFHRKHSRLKLCETSFMIKIIVISILTYLAAGYTAGLYDWGSAKSELREITYLGLAVIAGGAVCLASALLLDMKKYMMGIRHQ